MTQTHKTIKLREENEWFTVTWAVIEVEIIPGDVWWVEEL